MENDLILSSNNNDDSKIKGMSVDLESNTQNIVETLLQEQDPKKVKDLTHLFNISQTKKSVLRTMSYNSLLDKVNAQIEERLNKRADQFSNKDLLDYMDKMSSAIEKAQKQIKDVDTVPAIQINQQNINIGNNDNNAINLSRESRQNVMDVVTTILKKMESQNNLEIIEEEPVLDSDINNDNDDDEEILLPLNEEDDSL